MELDLTYTGCADRLEMMREEAMDARARLIAGTGEGSDFLGWIRQPEAYDRKEYARIKAAAEKIRAQSDILVVIGIGGSYLGARAVIEALSPTFPESGVRVLYAGNHLSAPELVALSRHLEGKRFSINVISKSGTTTEPAIAFRVLKAQLEAQVGIEAARERIFVTTDRSRGALKTLADQEGYETFVVPDNIGGRFTVLTAVGLLPIAVAGLDIDGLMRGAADGMRRMLEAPFEENEALRYAAVRQLMLRDGKSIEILVGYEPKLSYLQEWWKQLYGESEGKDGKGLFPASVANTTDLHSMGQWIQDGQRIIFESVLSIEHPSEDLTLTADAENLDELNYLAGKTLDEVNKKAMEGTRAAHVDGGVPNIGITIDRLDAYCFGELIYFFELAVGVSGYMEGVNPFNQPGVEHYKRNMFERLGKPGY